MISPLEKFNNSIESYQSVLSSAPITDIIRIYSGPPPVQKGTDHQRYYRIWKKYVVKQSQSVKFLYSQVLNSQDLLRVVSKESHFEILEAVHTEGEMHLGRDRMSVVLKQKYSGISKEFIKSCSECEFQKCKKQLKSRVTKPIRSSGFASRGQIDLIDLQNTPEINRPYNFLMVYQDHLTGLF